MTTRNITETTAYEDGTTQTITLISADYDNHSVTIAREVTTPQGDIAVSSRLHTSYNMWNAYETGSTPHTITRDQLERLADCAKRPADTAERATI